jgi:hypothetical protein
LCWPNRDSWFFVGGTGLALLTGVTYLVARHTFAAKQGDYGATVQKMALSHLQMLGVLGIFKARGTKVFNDVMSRPAEVVGGSLTSVLPFKCAFKSQVYAPFIMNMLLPPAIVCIASLIMLPTALMERAIRKCRVGKVAPKYKGKFNMPRFFAVHRALRLPMMSSDLAEWHDKFYPAQRLAGVVVFVLFTMYPTLVKSIASMFNCTSMIEGRSYLVADLTVECYVGMHIAFLVFASVGAIVYAVGIPTTVACVTAIKPPIVCKRGTLACRSMRFVRRDHEHYLKRSTRSRLAFLYNGYATNRSGVVVAWEALIMLRKLVVSLAASTIKDPYLQILVALLLLVVSALATAYVQPYEVWWLNLLDTFGLFVLIVTQILSIVYFYAASAANPFMDSKVLEISITATLFVLNAVTVTVFLLVWGGEIGGLREIWSRKHTIQLKIATSEEAMERLSAGASGAPARAAENEPTPLEEATECLSAGTSGAPTRAAEIEPTPSHYWRHPAGIAVVQPPQIGSEGVWVWREYALAASTDEPELLLPTDLVNAVPGTRFRWMSVATRSLSAEMMEPESISGSACEACCAPLEVINPLDDAPHLLNQKVELDSLANPMHRSVHDLSEPPRFARDVIETPEINPMHNSASKYRPSRSLASDGDAPDNAGLEMTAVASVDTLRFDEQMVDRCAISGRPLSRRFEGDAVEFSPTNPLHARPKSTRLVPRSVDDDDGSCSMAPTSIISGRPLSRRFEGNVVELSPLNPLLALQSVAGDGRNGAAAEMTSIAIGADAEENADEHSDFGLDIEKFAAAGALQPHDAVDLATASETGGEGNSTTNVANYGTNPLHAQPKSTRLVPRSVDDDDGSCSMTPTSIISGRPLSRRFEGNVVELSPLNPLLALRSVAGDRWNGAAAEMTSIAIGADAEESAEEHSDFGLDIEKFDAVGALQLHDASETGGEGNSTTNMADFVISETAEHSDFELDMDASEIEEHSGFDLDVDASKVEQLSRPAINDSGAVEDAADATAAGVDFVENSPASSHTRLVDLAAHAAGTGGDDESFRGTKLRPPMPMKHHRRHSIMELHSQGHLHGKVARGAVAYSRADQIARAITEETSESEDSTDALDVGHLRGWAAHIDANSEHAFYHNEYTDEKTWAKPSLPAAPVGWSVYEDDQGAVHYKSVATGVVQSQHPLDL